MKGPALVVLLGAVALAGCFDAPAAQSPLYAPKLVVDHTEDGQVELFVHNAFGERAYERIVLRVDNVTLLEANHTRAAITKIAQGTFYLEVEAHAANEGTFAFRGRLNLTEEGERLEVSTFHGDEQGWSEPRTFNLPHERILEREEAEA